ncbi:arginine--tRNA ligase [candidate division FCPU426 bacterium]|nr:arginine--tRNA ligase [candidate division FCPU426 bacterium]
MYLKQRVAQMVLEAVRTLQTQGMLPPNVSLEPELERPAQVAHGDFSTNIAMQLAKAAGKPPRVIAQALVQMLQAEAGLMESVEAAGPGFVNIKIKTADMMIEVDAIRQAQRQYGASEAGRGRKLLLEFVSANPTGPLNVVSARAAAVGDALANILQSQGVQVSREYYINDAGKQAHLLGQSMYATLKRKEDPDYPFPEGGYEKDYVAATATASADAGGAALREMNEGDAIIHHKEYGVQEMVKRHQKSLEEYGVKFDRWFYEHILHDKDKVQAVVDMLREKGHIYEKDEAVWFASTKFGDDKDRVLKKSDGGWAYMAADIAYHVDKFQRGYTELVDLWGPDHHGYIARMQAAMQALGYKPEQFIVHIVQQVNLLEDGKPVMMSKRGAGKLLEMDDLLADVGRDVARFFFLMRSTDSHLDFDLDLARQHSEDNPVYYVQYAHARICSILKKAAAEGVVLTSTMQSLGDQFRPEPEELALVRQLTAYPEIVEVCARTLEPHGLAFYLRDLATVFHRFYTVCRVVDASQPGRTQARLAIADAVRSILRNGLGLLGISAPEAM